jgi:hypothetical protein
MEKRRKKRRIYGKKDGYMEKKTDIWKKRRIYASVTVGV